MKSTSQVAKEWREQWDRSLRMAPNLQPSKRLFAELAVFIEMELESDDWNMPRAEALGRLMVGVHLSGTHTRPELEAALKSILNVAEPPPPRNPWRIFWAASVVWCAGVVAWFLVTTSGRSSDREDMLLLCVVGPTFAAITLAASRWALRRP